MSKDLRGLLKKMLYMSPDHRFSAKDLIKSPYFDSIRNKDQEEDADFKIKVSVDEELTFDYETFEDSVKTTQYIKLIKMELDLFKKSI